MNEQLAAILREMALKWALIDDRQGLQARVEQLEKENADLVEQVKKLSETTQESATSPTE